MSTLWKDLKFSARMLARNPGFTAVAVLALALGIGANSAIFSVTHALLLQPLPFDDPHQLVSLREDTKAWGTIMVSFPNFMDWRDQNRVFSDVTAYRTANFNLTGGDTAERLLATQGSWTLFRLLRVEPYLGRTFLEGEDKPAAERVVMLSHGLWQRLYGGDPDVIGKAISLDAEIYSIIGVAPPDFYYPLTEPNVDIYLPIGKFSQPWADNRGTHPGIAVTARLKPNVTLEEARADLDVIAKRLEQEYPEDNAGSSVYSMPLHQRLVRRVRPALMVLLAAVAFVLLIACANVANLLLAKASGRSQEIAVRMALGAGRARLLGQLLTESVLLSLIGGALGLLLGHWGVRLLLLGMPGESPPLYDRIGLDGTVVGFTVLLSILTGIVFGTVPALQTSRSNLVDSLKDGGRSASGGRSRERFRSSLVVVEVALALVLLVSAGLVIQSFSNIIEEDPGFNPENLLAVRISLPENKYSEERERAAFFQRLEETTASLPGVRSVGLTIPLLGGWQNSYVIEGRPAPRPGEYNLADYLRVNVDYFRTMEVRLVKGRLFSGEDREGSGRVAVIDETFKEKNWPGEEAIGKRFKFGSDPERDRPWFEVVGVVQHVKSYGVDRDSREEIYVPYRQEPERAMTLIVKSKTSSPESFTDAIRAEVHNLDPDQPIFGVLTLEQYLGERLATRRLSLSLLTVFAFVALLLASVGVYGVIAYAVNQRTHEIGIRMAMGARVSDVLTMVLRYGMSLAGLGLLIGIVAAFLATPLLASQLFGIHARDPWTLVATTLILGAVAFTACLVPARRATRVTPVIALRYE